MCQFKVTFKIRGSVGDKLLEWLDGYSVQPDTKQVTFIGGKDRISDAIYEYMNIYKFLYLYDIQSVYN